MTAPHSSQAGLASFSSSRPRPTQGDWEQMLADEHAQGLHGDGCGCIDWDTPVGYAHATRLATLAHQLGERESER